MGKSISCAHWWEKRSLISFYILDLLRTITANVPMEKKFNDDALFEGAVWKDCRLKFCTVVYKRLRECGSWHNVSRNAESCVKYQTYCFSLEWPKLKLYCWSSVFDINQANWNNNFSNNLSFDVVYLANLFETSSKLNAKLQRKQR